MPLHTIVTAHFCAMAHLLEEYLINLLVSKAHQRHNTICISLIIIGLQKLYYLLIDITETFMRGTRFVY